MVNNGLVVSGKGEVRQIDKTSDVVVQKVIDAVKEAHEGTIEYVRSPVGKTTAPINSYFAVGDMMILRSKL